MPTLQITAQSFGDTIENNPIVILDFWAAWCGPCQRFAPVFEAASDKHTDILFAKIDTDAEGPLASAFSIRSVPTLMVLREKVVVYREAGAASAGDLERLIAAIRALDMQTVRAEIAANQVAGQPGQASA